jgi:hypothetical protein
MTTTETGPLRVVQLTAENFKALRAVEITPDGDLVVVSGRNGQGKTSVLDAIWQAVGGAAASKGTPEPIRQGADTARVTVNLGDLTVTRTWTRAGSTLRVESADGLRYPSPQKVLDALVGRLAFDPLAFTRASAREQRGMLLDLVDVPVDLDALDRERADVFADRTGLSRMVRDLRARLDAMPVPDPDLPDEPVDIREMLIEMAAARVRITDAEDAERRLVSHEEQLARLQEEAHRAAQLLFATRGEIQAVESAMAEIKVPDVTGDRDLVETLQERIASADSVNRAIMAREERESVAYGLADAESTVAMRTDLIAEIDRAKADALAAAVMPVEGLSVTEDAVTFRGVPFGQCSAAEQLRVSVGMAMAANPRLRVLRITDGSLLDAESMRVLGEMAADRGFQVWIERVDDSGSVGVVIEDGTVAAGVES